MGVLPLNVPCNSKPYPPPPSVESFLRASMGVLREASEPPLHRASERAQLLRHVLAALAPAALGGLLGPR